MVKNTLQFLKQGFLKFNETGTIMPCSSIAGKKMAKSIKGNERGDLIELGAGTGSITKQILKKMGKDQKLLAFEINKKFCETLEKIKDPRLRVINDSAENFDKYIEEKPSFIISTLPLTIFKKSQKEQLLNKIKENMSRNTKYVQIQYSLKEYRRIKSFFPSLKLDFVLLNAPPAFVFNCQN